MILDYNALLSSMVGGCFVIIGAKLTEYYKKKAVRHHTAVLIACDLTSIRNYLFDERSSVKMLYDTQWRNTVSNCDFLDGKELQDLYEFYRLMEKFDYFQHNQSQIQSGCFKESIVGYKELKSALEDSRFSDLCKKIIKHAHF